MQQRGDEGGGEELLVIERGIEERDHAGTDRLHAHAHGLGWLAPLVACGHLDASRQRAHGGAHVTLDETRMRAQLGVVQQGDLGRPALFDAAREIGRNENRRVDAPGPQRPLGLGSVLEALGNVQPRRGLQKARELARQPGVVVVHHTDGQARGQTTGKNPPQEPRSQQGNPADEGKVPWPGCQ